MTQQLARIEQDGTALTPQDAQRIADYAAEGVAENTRRAYRSQADRFAAWAEGRDLEPLAALTDQGLAAYLSERADQGASPATLSQAVAALRQAARQSGTADPYGNGSQAVLRGIRRSRAAQGARGQVDGLRWREVEQVATLAAAAGTPVGLRDAALVRVASDALLRVSEVAAVQVADLEAAEDGSGRLTVRRSKTDQEGRGTVLYLGPPTMQAVRKWQAAGNVAEGALFRRVWGRSNTVGADALTGRTVRRVLKARAEAAGVEGRISGHSARVGSAQDLAAAGAELTELMNAGRWQSPTMPAHYAQGQLAGRGAVARLRYGGRQVSGRADVPDLDAARCRPGR